MQVIELTENLVKEARSKELVQEHNEESQAEYYAPQSEHPSQTFGQTLLKQRSWGQEAHAMLPYLMSSA